MLSFETMFPVEINNHIVYGLKIAFQGESLARTYLVYLKKPNTEQTRREAAVFMDTTIGFIIERFNAMKVDGSTNIASLDADVYADLSRYGALQVGKSLTAQAEGVPGDERFKLELSGFLCFKKLTTIPTEYDPFATLADPELSRANCPC